jgi:AcrR family transcriptional regulator
MTAEEKSTEDKILMAARNVFIRKGMDGTRMQEIADEAGINKALLHYYFRSKDKLFEAVFRSIIGGFFGSIAGAISGGMTTVEKADFIISRYIKMIEENPFAPQFIINEINRNPQVLRDIMFSFNINPQQLVQSFDNGSDKKSPFDPRQFVITFLSMSIFPYAARNLLQMVYFEDDKEAYNRFLEERKIFIKHMIIKMLQE